MAVRLTLPTPPGVLGPRVRGRTGRATLKARRRRMDRRTQSPAPLWRSGSGPVARATPSQLGCHCGKGGLR